MEYGGKRKRKFILIVVIFAIVLFLGAFIIGSNIGKGNIENERGHEYTKEVISSSIQKTLSPCHSTEEHKLALFNCDTNNDNYLSKEELEPFLDEHPLFIYDEPFLKWLGSIKKV